MRITVHHGSLSGILRAPPSKSYTHRALFCSALAQGESTVHSPLLSDDTRATSDALSKIGVETEWNDGTAYITRSGEFKKPAETIVCGESGTTLRFMTAVCALMSHGVRISGGPSLLRRPVKELAVALCELGAECLSNQGYPPVSVRGPIKGGSVEIPGNVSSQFVSALLLAAPMAEGLVEVRISGRLESKPYVQMTLDMQDKFGVRVDAADDLTRFHVTPRTYRPSVVDIEGDWSSAAFLIAGGTIAGDKVRVSGLAKESLQPDQELLLMLKKMNARVSQDSESVTVERSSIEPVEVDVSDCPDLFPVICALCATSSGVSTIKGIRRLRAKESNRVQAMGDGLKRMGISIQESEDLLVIRGGRPSKAVIDPHHDHRIAMAFAMLGLRTGDVTVVDADCVGKSYPSFWSDLRSLGAKVTMS